MDTKALVEKKVEDGLRLIHRLLECGFSLRAAAWLKGSEDDRWHLFLVNDLPDEEGSYASYKAVDECIEGIPNLQVTLSEIKIIDHMNPVGKALEKIQRGRAQPSPFTSMVSALGNFTVEEGSVIYPVTAIRQSKRGRSMTEEDILNHVLRCLNNQQVDSPTMVTLRDGSTFYGIPFGLERTNKGMVIKFVVEGKAPYLVSLSEIAKM